MGIMAFSSVWVYNAGFISSTVGLYIRPKRFFEVTYSAPEGARLEGLSWYIVRFRV